MSDNVSNSAVIIGLAESVDMIWLSEQGGVAASRGEPNLYRLAPSMMGSMY